MAVIAEIEAASIIDSIDNILGSIMSIDSQVQNQLLKFQRLRNDGEFGIFLATRKVLGDARRRGGSTRRMNNTPQGESINGNVADDILIVDQDSVRLVHRFVQALEGRDHCNFALI